MAGPPATVAVPAPRAPRGEALALLLGVPHLVVDASSNFTMMVLLRPATPVETLAMLVAYNFAAFALQPVVGLVADGLRRPRTVMCFGLLLAAAALLLLDAPFWIPLTLTGVGNAMFHVGGGTAASAATAGRASGPGLFIAPGAVGVALGAAAGRSMPGALWPLFAGLVAFALLGALVPSLEDLGSSSRDRGRLTRAAALAVPLLLLAIALRSLLGARAVGPLASHAGWAVPLAFASFTGKAFGGVVADRAGWKRTAVASLLLSSVLLTVADRSAWLAAAAVISFQAVTGITLAALYRAVPGRLGLCFGLACLAIFAGALPVLLRFDLARFAALPLNSAVALASVAAVWAGLSLLDRLGPAPAGGEERRSPSVAPEP